MTSCAAARCAIRIKGARVEEYRTANPDDWSTIGAMPRKFNQWLHDSRHAQAIADKLPKVRVRARYGAADAEMSDKAVAVKGS